MTSAKRPSSSPAHTRPSPAPKAYGAAQCGELQLLARTLCLPLLAQPSSAELVAQITSAENDGEVWKAIQGVSGVTFCTAFVHATFKLIDQNNVGTTLSRAVVLKALRDSEQVRGLLQALHRSGQGRSACDFFDKACQAIAADGSKLITLTEFEAYFVPAQRKPRPLSQLLVRLSLAAAGLGLTYAIVVIGSLVSRPTLAELWSAAPHFFVNDVGGAASAAQVAASSVASGGGAVTAAAAAAAANAATLASFDSGSGLPQWDAASVRDATAKVSAAAAAAADARADSMSSAKMAAHKKDKKEKTKKGTSKKKNKSGRKNRQGQGGKDADNSEASKEELTRRTVKEVMAGGGTAKMRAMRARGRDAGGSATTEMKEKTSLMQEKEKETALGGAGRARKPKRKTTRAKGLKAPKDEV